MRTKPYIGVTGASSKEEVEEVCRRFSDASYAMSGDHIPMLGFLVSREPLGGQDISNRRYPAVDTLPELLQATRSSVMTTIHYRSRERDTLADQVGKLFTGIYEKGLCNAVQFNIIWPDVKQVKMVKDMFPEMKIVLQASDKAMADNSPREIMEKVRQYGDSLDYCLIDPSGGRGMEFDIERPFAIYLEIKREIPDLTIGFAGGFTGENTADRLRRIIKRISRQDFFIDAEGGLRDKVTEKQGNDLLNLDNVGAYLRAAASVLK